jgi:hypothetical protein
MLIITPDKSAAVMRHEKVQIVVSLGSQRTPDATWRAYVDACIELCRKLGPPEAALLVAPFVAPSAAQRHDLAQHDAETGYGQLQRVALVSGSAMTRGAITAISWLLRQPLRTYSPQQLGQAWAYVAPGAAPAVLPTLMAQIVSSLDPSLQDTGKRLLVA